MARLKLVTTHPDGRVDVSYADRAALVQDDDAGAWWVEWSAAPGSGSFALAWVLGVRFEVVDDDVH